MRPHLYGEQTGPSQAAGGSANGLTAILGGSKFSGDRADMEGKSCDDHYLAWLCRRSRCFSRSVEMMVYSLQLRFFLRLNGGSWVSILS